MPRPPHPVVEVAATVGNGRLLAGFDGAGGMRTLTAPHLDHPQHLRWTRLAITSGRGRRQWLDGRAWRHEQSYLDGTNVLVTRSRRSGSAVVVEHRASAVDDALIIGIRCTGRPNGAWSLEWELGLQVGGQSLANAAVYDPRQDIVLAYRRRHTLAIALVPAAAQVRGRTDHDAGWAESQSGGPRFAIVGEVILQFSAAVTAARPVLLVVSAGQSAQLMELVTRLRARRFGSDWPPELAPPASSASPPPMGALGPLKVAASGTYVRSLLTIGQLTDRSGAILAGPPVDARFQRSGGYAFCWPRDGAFIAAALDVAGRLDAARAFYDWALAHQPEDGIWEQRYYADGTLAPRWAAHQLDETGTLLWALDRHLARAPDPKLAGTGLRAAHRAYARITALAAESGWPPATENLWEDQQGAHLYTLAALLAGAERWRERAHEQSAASMSTVLEHAAARLREALAGWPVDPTSGALARAQVRKGTKVLPDFTPDASLLGLSVPFELVPAGDPRLQATAQALIRALMTRQGRMRRYTGDRYRGGNPWPLLSLWLAWHHVRAGNRAEALRLYRRVIEDRTPAGLFAEQVDARTGQALWVVPLSWAHAWFLVVTHALLGSASAAD